ncbi:dynein regulatory complex subunit 5-like [Cataglyphis hispanica]|uniref:dynein regulatory complex subunit 5-like n=1 Tax=Cataglyphis hispanica TaxID=1086592 RepID=UPI0021803813|nr:dynein regulatory complex subunit 5-like [Cataglyphis hispanica]
MRIPHSISKNVVAAYRCSPETLLLPQEQGRTLRAEDASWDDGAIPDLKTLALRAIVSTWKDNPILEDLPTCVDRELLLEILPTDLPFESTITKIADGFYWERAAKDRWEQNDPGKYGDSWRRLYCERHLSEYLETLEASYFEAQRKECEKLINLVKDYIYVIRLRSLVPTKKLVTEEDDEESALIDKDIVHHIPMAIILPQLPNLTEIYLNFGMIYMDDGFEWRDFKFSLEDCISLGEGIKASPKLKKFSLTRSNLDQHRIAAILQGMALNDNIEELDVSHCKLMDTGAHAVGEFLSMHRKLKTLHLTNNNIGPSGVAGIVFGILKGTSTALKNLNLRLNPLQDEGANHVCALLVRNKTLETLNISGCELGSEAGIALAGVLSSGCVELETLSLDISNNDFGLTAGESFEAAMASASCSYIIHLDGRMCNFSKESEYSINESAYRNKQNMKKERIRAEFSRRDDYSSIAKDLQQQPEAGPSLPESLSILTHFTEDESMPMS